MSRRAHLNLIKTTAFCSIVGILIPGFTAIVLLGLQTLVASLGVECANSLIVVWTFTTIVSISLPLAFTRFIGKHKGNRDRLETGVILFNLFEYLFLQSSLAVFFTNGDTLCYVTDGQNGMELVFTGWLALPILIGLSALFQMRYNHVGNNDES